MKFPFFSRKKSKQAELTFSPQKRVLIFGLGRTGSTLLEDLLQSTGYFKAHGELFRPSEALQLKPLDYFIEKASSCQRHFISHIKVYQMESVVQSELSKRDFFEGLQQNGWQFIYLTRKNRLKHLLSSVRAQESSIYHTETVLPVFTTTVDCFQFKHGVQQLEKWEAEELELLENLPYLKIEYERDLEDGLSHAATIEKILDYLDLPHRPFETKLKKVIRGELSSIITNYDEFAEEMRAAGYEEFLKFE
jgi:LPS sulfotransferase NodH